jgi:hypothetical protein
VVLLWWIVWQTWSADGHFFGVLNWDSSVGFIFGYSRNGKNNRRSFGYASRDETAKDFAQDDNFVFGLSILELLRSWKQSWSNGAKGKTAF